jgi:predicted MFS family arabinose efflux permease
LPGQDEREAPNYRDSITEGRHQQLLVGPPPSERRRFFLSDDPPLWRNPDFLLLWGGQVVSSLGSRVSGLALPLLLLASTGSPLWAGILTALDGVPAIVLGLPIGALVDRWDRKRMLVLSDLARALALGSVPALILLGNLTLPLLIAVVLVEGTLGTFFSHARGAAVARVVRKDQLANAIAQEQATDSLSGMIGPAIGGILFGLGAALPFLVDAGSFLISAISLSFLKGPLQSPDNRAGQKVSLAILGAEIRDGLAWLRDGPSLRVLALLTGGLHFFSAGSSLIFILLAQRLGATSAEIGILIGTAGLGSLVGALLSAVLLRRFSVGRVIVLSAWVWALGWPLYVLAPSVLWLGVVNALGWIVDPIYTVAQTTYRLGLVPDEYLGRANSVFRLMTVGLQPLGLALAGALLQVMGPASTVLVISVPQVLFALVATFDGSLLRAQVR